MEVLLADFRKRTKMGQNSVGVWRFPPSSNAPSGGTPLMVPTMPSAVGCSCCKGSWGWEAPPPPPSTGPASALGSLVGHSRKLVSDAAQSIQHGVQRLLTQFHSDG